MTEQTRQPEGAAKLVDPGKLTGVQAPEVDPSLLARGGPGQPRPAAPAPSQRPPRDDGKLPRDAAGAPRDLTFAEMKKLKDAVTETLRTVFDPEIPVNIYELGLVYNVSVTPRGLVEVRMTLTSPACPVAGTLPGDVERKLRGVDWVAEAVVILVWEPPWTKSMMSEAAKLELNIQ